MTSDDEWVRLWRGCVAGDPVLTEAFCRHADVLIRGFCRRWLPNPERAADRSQSFFLWLFEQEQHRLRSFRPELGVPLPAYLRVLAWRFHIARGRSRSEQDEGRAMSFEQVIDTLTSPPEVERLLVSREVREAVDTLPTREREATLWRLEGMRDEEIARLMAISAGGVAALLSRARDRLRDRLGGT